jgi:hypothetical protein
MNTGSDFLGQSGFNGEAQREGRVARAIESRTAQLPSDLFLWIAGAAMVGSLATQILGMRRGVSRGILGSMLGNADRPAPVSTFIGQWVPSLLLFGIYNKIVKVAGSDRVTR